MSPQRTVEFDGEEFVDPSVYFGGLGRPDTESLKRLAGIPEQAGRGGADLNKLMPGTDAGAGTRFDFRGFGNAAGGGGDGSGGGEGKGDGGDGGGGEQDQMVAMLEQLLQAQHETIQAMQDLQDQLRSEGITIKL